MSETLTATASAAAGEEVTRLESKEDSSRSAKSPLLSRTHSTSSNNNSRSDVMNTESVDNAVVHRHLDKELKSSSESDTDRSDSPSESSAEGVESPKTATKSGCCQGPISCFGSCRVGAADFAEELKHMTRNVDVKRWAKKTCSLESAMGKLPIVKWLPKYRLKHFQSDLIAGLTVGLTVIPQGLAYAKVAGLSPEYGLYSAFMGCFVYMFFGTSKDITLGPTAIMSLLTAEFGNSPIDNDATYAILLSFIGGIIQLVMGILHIGFVVDYISHPVINSFTTAAAITIGWGQIKSWLGLKKIPKDFINDVIWTLRKLPETILWDFLMGLCCIILLYALKKLREVNWGDTRTMSKQKKIIKYIIWLVTTSRNAIIVVIASGVSAGFLQHNHTPFTLTGHIKPGLPQFKAPSFTLSYENTTLSASEVFSNIGPGFAILPLLGLVETIAIGKAFARKNNYDIDADQELLAIGISNIIGSFVGAYPVTGSFSRTAVNSQSGVMTPMGGLWTATLVLLALAFLTPLFYYIPNAALAAVIIMAVVDMIDFTLLPKLWKIKKADLIPWIVTFICCLLIGIEWGICIGVGLSILMLMYPYSRPQVQLELSHGNNDIYEVLTVDQGLMFPGIKHFTERVYKKTIKNGKAKSVILDMACIANADYTSVEGVEQLIDDFTKQNKQLILCNMRPYILDIYKRATIKHFVHARSVEEAVQLINKVEANKDPPSISYMTPVMPALEDVIKILPAETWMAANGNIYENNDEDGGKEIDDSDESVSSKF